MGYSANGARDDLKRLVAEGTPMDVECAQRVLESIERDH